MNDDDILEAVFVAADEHGKNSYDRDHTVGDLQGVLRAAWQIMTPEQRRALLRADEVEAAFTMSDAGTREIYDRWIQAQGAADSAEQTPTTSSDRQAEATGSPAADAAAASHEGAAKSAAGCGPWEPTSVAGGRFWNVWRANPKGWLGRQYLVTKGSLEGAYVFARPRKFGSREAAQRECDKLNAGGTPAAYDR